MSHTLQQGSTGAGGGLALGSPTSPEEARAEAAADAIMAGQPARLAPISGPVLQRRAEPYIDQITVNLTPKQSANLHWQGTPPADAPGSDDFTVSTGKGYDDPPGDPPGTCTRHCCDDPKTQCARHGTSQTTQAPAAPT